MTWAEFLRSRPRWSWLWDFIETVTLTGARQYTLAVVHHAGSRVSILGTTVHPTHAWVTQAVRNLLKDLEDVGSRARVRFLIRDRDGKYPALIDEILGAGIATILTGVRVPRMNAIMERWVKTLRVELLDRTLIWNEAHLRHALQAYEQHYNQHRTHRSLAALAPLRAQLQPLGPDRNRTPRGTPTGPSRRSPSGVSACRLNCADVVFGTRKAERLALRPALDNVPAPVKVDVAEIYAAIALIGDVSAALQGHAPTRLEELYEATDLQVRYKQKPPRG